MKFRTLITLLTLNLVIVPEYLCNSGIACLLLPSAVLLNDHTNQFQKQWFQAVTVDRIVNFSDLRFVLFSKAVHPCVGIRFRSIQPEQSDQIRYETPKTDNRSQQGGPVYVREEDVRSLKANGIINAAAICKNQLHSNRNCPHWGWPGRSIDTGRQGDAGKRRRNPAVGSRQYSRSCSSR